MADGYHRRITDATPPTTGEPIYGNVAGLAGVASPANAFAAQDKMFQWLGGFDAEAARMIFQRLYHSKDPERSDIERPATDEEIADIKSHVRLERRMFREGTPVFVTAEVVDLVNEAVVEMPSEVLLEQDLPFQDFVLWLEQPIPYHPLVLNEAGEVISELWNVDAIGIQFMPNTILVQDRFVGEGIAGSDAIHRRTPTTTWANQDEIPDNVQLTDGVMLYVYASSRSVEVNTKLRPGDAYGPYCLLDLLGVGFDIDWATRNIDGPARELHKWVIALMRLMGEHIELRPQGVGRPLLRAAQRSGRKIPKDGYLTVMHLRRLAYGPHSSPGESVASRKLRWRHRVRGHWKKVYCPSRQLPVGDPGAYRYRYVNAYVRGPQEAPLIESHRVVAVDR